MSLRTNRKTAATVTTYFVKVGKAPLRRLFLSIQLFLCFYFHLFLFMFAYLFCSCSPNSKPLSTHSTDREIPLTCYLLRPTRMSFFWLGRKPLVCGHKLSICIRSTARSVLAGCLWSGIGGVMGECERLDSELLEPKGCQDDGVYKGGIERME